MYLDTAGPALHVRKERRKRSSMRTILVIEDDPNVLDNVLDLLQGEGFFTIGASSGEEGLEAVRKHQPNLILCDIMMPEMDGLEVLRRIREDKATSATPVIFLTARAARADYREGMELGADDYLTKPFTADELLSAVRSRLTRHDEQGHWYQQRLQDLRNNLSRNLPHELRTPLSSILGYSQFLLEVYETAEIDEVRDMLEEINRAGRRLERLVENYHLYAQLELAATDPGRQTTLFNLGLCHPENVIPSAAQEQARIAGRSDDLVVDVAPGEVRMQDDYLEKVAEELVRNAFMYSPQGSTVRVIGTVEEDNYQFDVADEGRGLPEDQLEKIGAFIQFDREKHEQQGLGLGLSLTQRLVELYRGTLYLRSAPGQGMTVRVRLPLAE
jgi:signal transduction histidine kinase